MEILLITIAGFIIIYLTFNPQKVYRFPLNMATGSLITLTLLFLLRIIDLNTIRDVVIGTTNFKPWQIIIIFFTVAYVSISTDITGIFDYIAYKIAKKAQGKMFYLFLYFYLFSCVLTIFTSNDIVILTLTPIIFYMGKHSKINILPLLFAQFFATNTTSMLLYIGNPTNIIVANALGMKFRE